MNDDACDDRSVRLHHHRHCINVGDVASVIIDNICNLATPLSSSSPEKFSAAISAIKSKSNKERQMNMAAALEEDARWCRRGSSGDGGNIIALDEAKREQSDCSDGKRGE